MNYIGSKLSLLEFIDESLTSLVGESLHDNMMLCDIFAGTNVVGSYFKNKGYSVISNDIQTFGFYLGKVLIENNEKNKIIIIFIIIIIYVSIHIGISKKVPEI